MSKSLPFLIALLCASLHAGAAEDFPSKPIRLLVPFTPGGAPTWWRA